VDADGTPGSTRPRRKRRILGLDDEQRQSERRRLLLDAALELFGTRGYTNTSIELLCQTAAIGTNSFYELYPNKEAVMVGLYDRISDQLRQALTDEYAAHRDDADPIRPLVSAFVHAAVDDPRIARVAIVEMTLDWLLNDDPDPIEKLIDDIAHHCRRVSNAIVAETAQT
jgi:AcrR family transcriptional regulator